MSGRKRSFFNLLPLIAVLAVNCSAAKPIHRETLPDQRPEVDILGQQTALIRTAESDISLCLLSDEQWEKLQGFSSFKNNMFGEPSKKIPFELFFVTVTNTSEQQLSALSASCTTGETTVSVLSQEQISAKTASPSFKHAALGKIFAYRRLTTLEYEFGKINFDKDTLSYPFSFILPLDRICYLIAFQPIPADIRHFTVSILYSTPSAKKKVDFKFTKTEHRDEE